MADDKLIFPIGFDLEEGVKKAGRDWKNHYRKRLQDAIDSRPLKVKIDFESKGIDTKEFKQWMALSREAEKLERERIKNAKEWQKVADQAAMAETRRANATNESNARIERANRKAEASEQRKAQAVERTNAAYAQQSTYLSRLFQRMAAYASVAQALSFVRNVREVTAEFELQRVALGALLQDAHKANQIFEEIKIQAVKSPYEVKDLVSYTRQLAAYGVKANDLMGTMNRLADVSAGLGADMNRIILAYGQIQAAGVLKGTELRQLTELGLPMVELLSEYYSTLRNEIVSTSEVIDMMSKKEIPFQAVKDILEDLTSEGGRFYEMQAVQAETLAGQWANMKDTMTIMYDEIGRSEEVRGILNLWIDSTKWLAANWREVWSAVKLVGGTYAILKSLTIAQKAYNTTTTKTVEGLRRYLFVTEKIPQFYKRIKTQLKSINVQSIKNLAVNAKQALSWKNLGNAINRAGLAIKRFGQNLLWATLSNPVGWITGIMGVIASFDLFASKSRDAMDSFREGLREAVKENAKSAAVMQVNFKKLALAVVESADGSAAQLSALRKLKEQYGEMFPEYKLTVEYLRQVAQEGNNAAEAFDKMAQNIQSYMSVTLRQKMVEDYMTKLNEMFADTFELLTDEHGPNFSKAVGEVMRAGFEEGMTEEELATRVEEAMGGFDVYFNNLGAYSRLMDLGKAAMKASSEIDGMMQSFDNLNPSLAAVNRILDDTRLKINKISQETGGKSQGDVAQNIKDETLKAINEALSAMLLEEGLRLEVGDIFNIGDIIDKGQIELADGSFKKLNDATLDGINKLRAMAGVYDDQWKEALANMVSYLDDGKRKVQAFSSDQIDSFGYLWQALPEVAKRYDELKGTLEGLSNTYNALKSAPIEEQDVETLEDYRQEISETEEIMRHLYSFLEKYGGLKLIKDDSESELSILQSELQLHEKIYAKYKEYRKAMSAEEAKKKVEGYFDDAIDALKFKPSFDKSGYQSVLEQYKKEANALLAKAKDETEKASIKKFLLNIGFKIGDVDWQETRDDLTKRLNDLSNDISRTKTAKEFFDKMLGMTGDRELSATLTMSVYGTTGDDLQKLMTKEVEEAFRNLPEGFDITKAMLGDGKFDYNLLESWIEKLPEQDRESAKSIVNNWRKANADILTGLQKSYEDFMTYEERKTRVVERELANRKKIEESQYTQEEKDKLMRASRQAEKKELGAIAIEEFKASDDWIKSFEDLESLATPTIERLMLKLKEFITLNKEALTSEQLKTLMGEYDKLYDGLIARNPIQAITDSIKEYRTAMQGVALAQEALDAAKALGDKDLIAFAERGLTDAFDDARKAVAKLEKGIGNVSDKFTEAQQLVDSFTDTLGISEDTEFGAFLDGISNALGGVSKAFAFAQLAVQLFDGSIKSMLASNPIGWILLAVSAVVSAVQAIANARVKRIDNDIEALEHRLDSLSYAYDRLQKAQDKAFGSDFISNYQRQLENLEAQQEAYLKQADLERSKGKKADEGKIKEYERQARDAADAIKDMYGSLSMQFLGTDITSAARDFASAWIEAYKEFSNTTDAMKEKFQDMIQNMIVESLLAKVMEKALEPVFTMIDNMQEGDFYSSSFWQDIMTTMQTATENGVVGAENIMSMLEQMGINLRGLGGEMTGISRDIAVASEDSILGLAAGINTQNFYISQVPTKLDTIIGLLRGDGAIPQGSAMTLQDVMIAQNQFLSHLPTIAQHTAETVAECKMIVAETRRTADALERVIKPDGTRTTYKMNVVTTYQG